MRSFGINNEFRQYWSQTWAGGRVFQEMFQGKERFDVSDIILEILEELYSFNKKQLL